MNSGEGALALRLLPGQQLAQAHQLPLQLGEDLCHPGRKDLLATSDCTSLASSPSSSEVSQLEYRTSLQPPLRTPGWIWSWLAVAFPAVRPSSPWMLFSSQTSPTMRPP